MDDRVDVEAAECGGDVPARRVDLLLARKPSAQRGQRAAAVREQDAEPRVLVEHARAEHVRRGERRLDRVADGVPEVVLVHRRQREAARARVDEDERARLLGGGPEVAEARVAEVRAVRRGRDLDAAEAAVQHQLGKLRRSRGIDSAEHAHARAGERGERFVLALDLDAAEIDPWAEHDDVNAGAVLLLEDPPEVGELARSRADLAALAAHDLDAVAPRHLRPESRDDHVRVAVDDHAGSARRISRGGS